MAYQLLSRPAWTLQYSTSCAAVRLQRRAGLDGITSAAATYDGIPSGNCNSVRRRRILIQPIRESCGRVKSKHTEELARHRDQLVAEAKDNQSRREGGVPASFHVGAAMETNFDSPVSIYPVRLGVFSVDEIDTM